MKKLVIGFLFLMLVGCQSQQQHPQPSPAAVDSVLNDWHEAAAQADFARYFDHFASDSAIFMGTDASERWTVAEFRRWAKPYFKRGQAWSFTPAKRHVYFSEDGQIAWFDESLDTPNLGPARGSGVLRHKEGEWKIAHYNLSVPIPNALMDSVVQQIKEYHNDSKDSNE